MNRKQRRLDEKRARKGPPGAGDPAMRALFERGVAAHKAGRLDEAIEFYRQMLTANPNHADALNMQGVIQLQRGNADAAVVLIRQSLNAFGRNPRAHYNLGLALNAKGDTKAALASFRNAVALDERNFEAHSNVGAILLEDDETLAEAIVSLRTALAISPSYGEARNNLAIALSKSGDRAGALAEAEAAAEASPHHRPAVTTYGMALLQAGTPRRSLAVLQAAHERWPDDAAICVYQGRALSETGRSAEALSAFEQALSLDPASDDALHNMGLIHLREGRMDEALAAFERAIEISPRRAQSLHLLGTILLAKGEVADGIGAMRRALALTEGDPASWQRFADALSGVEIDRVPADVAADLGRTLMHPEIDARPLSTLVTRLILARPEAAALLTEAEAGDLTVDADAVKEGTPLMALGADLTVLLLLHGRVTDHRLEQVLTALRRAMLALAVQGRLPEHMAPAMFAFIAALSCQCCANGYVFSVTVDEEIQAEMLAASIENRLTEPEPWPLAAIALLGCYRPLDSLPSKRLLPPLEAQDKTDFFKQLLARHLHEPAARAEAEATLSEGGAPSSDAAIAAMHFYDANPFPAWRGIHAEIQRGFSSHAAQMFPHTWKESGEVEAPDILVAGCGTGQAPLSLAARYREARVLALDLSRAGLAYALERVKALDAPDIAWLQGDIARVDTLGRQFDMIDCRDVLHETEEPLEMWRKLLTVLKPGGVMRLGFRSALGQRVATAAQGQFRTFEVGAPVLERLRAFREKVMAAPENDELRQLLSRQAFYSCAGMLGLVDPPSTKCFTLPEVSEMLNALNLDLLGFGHATPSVLRLYNDRFPEDPPAVRLDLWQRFEEEFPDIFARGYIIWAARA